jgi:hypothetical protein
MAEKIILKLLLVLALPNFLAAQQEDKIVSLNKLLMVQATISPGYMFYKGGLWNSYFHATLEWCFDDKVSIRSDGSYFFTTQGDYKLFKMNHSLLLGAFYHFPKKKCDFYLGLQPGAALVQQTPYTYNDSTISNPRLKVAPIMTATIGANYFFWKYMNMFVALKIVHGTHISEYGTSIPLDELRISAGLGWQLQFKKKNVTPVN